MDKFYKILNEFANGHTLAKDMEIYLSLGTDHYEARDGGGAKFEDVNLLSSIVRGAENFCYFLKRNGYVIKKGK